ncbi:MAG TPA: hypothetical protein VJ888_09120 [Mobilitalea sp.]|nr:hypothetical protein [Mobilitalea sp.]
MGKKNIMIRNNQGTSLLLVVVSATFLMILCSVLLHLAVINNEMKAIERKSKNNFYSAETALEEIKAGIGIYVSEALEKAYINVMECYIDKTEEEKRRLMAECFISELENCFCTSLGSSMYRLDLVESFLTNSTAALITSHGENILDKDTVNTEEPQYIILRNIKISYLDSENYKTNLSTDIVICTPDYDAAHINNLDPAFASYSIIADQGISLQTAVDVNVNGNIYAGEGGILLDNLSDFKIVSAENVVTRGDIKVRERSSLVIEGNPMIWAKNMTILKGSDSVGNTSIDITGKCFVADDLSLNARASKVTIDGEYYGYSYRGYKTPVPDNPLSAANSSAIIINGKDSILDLSVLKTLFIAGRAYLDPGLSGSVVTDVYTGESISVKDSQYAYLVPAQYLWCAVNPVPAEIYQTYHTTPVTEPEVDFDKEINPQFPIQLQDYADGVSKLFYQLAGGQNYVYYYLKFKSQEHANEYLRKYYEVYKNGSGIGIVDIDRQIGSNVETIILNSTLRSIMCAGNIYTFNRAELSSLIPSNIDLAPDLNGDKSASLMALEQIASHFTKQYDSLQRSLEPVTRDEIYDEASLFNSIIHTQNLQSDITDVEVRTIGEYVVYIINNAVGTPYEFEFNLPNDASLPNNGRKGIIIASGTVNVSGTFDGMIIAGKDIKLESTAVVNASKDIVMGILGANDSDVNRYFRAFATQNVTGGTGEDYRNLEASNLIAFENWRKNRE